MVPFFFEKAMTKNEIIEKISGSVAQRGCFIVDVTVSRDNDVELTIESEEGVVDLDDCEAINDVFCLSFDREKEDYALTVSSAGLDQPFKVLKQYLKAVGTEVEVKLKGGKKLIGELRGADEVGIVLKYSVKEAVQGKKKKEMVEHEENFALSEINSVMPYITFD